MNSMPSTLARIMRLTALQPPPPTPMTLIFAGDSSSLKLIRIALSFAVICFPRSPIESAGKPVLLCEAGLRGKFFAEMRRLRSFVRLRRTQDDNRFAGRQLSPAISRTGLKPGTTLGKPTAPVRRPATTKTRTKHGSKARHCKSDNGPPRKAATTKTRTKHGSKARHCKSDNGPPRKAAPTKTGTKHGSKARHCKSDNGPPRKAAATKTRQEHRS